MDGLRMMGKVVTMKRMTGIMALCAIVLIASTAFGANIHPGAGTVSGLVLEMGSGAKAIALGGAQTGSYGDADMYYWNVGAMGMASGLNASFSHLEWLMGTRMEHIAALYSLGRYGVVGVNADFMGYGDEKRTVEDVDGTYLKEDGTFSGNDIVAGLSYGYRTGDISAGLGINYLHSDYDGVWANAAALNLGLLFVTPVEGLTAGVTVKNIGTRIRFIDKGFEQPLNARIGMRYSGILNNMLTVYSDVRIPAYQYPSVHLGLEVTPIEYVSVRLGYRYEYGNALGWYTGFTGGLGININEKILKVGKLTLDYAFVPYGDLGMTHRVSLGFTMGKGSSPSEEVKLEKNKEVNKEVPVNVSPKDNVPVGNNK
jgi:hypothetical protein